MLGTNKDATAAVIPFWHRSRVQGLVRRKLTGKPKYPYPKADEYPSGIRPLFVPGSIRGEIFLVEGIVDALALAALDTSAVAVGGTNISEVQVRELKQLPGPLYILPNNDESGAEAARKWLRDLYPNALLCPPEYRQEKEDA